MRSFDIIMNLNLVVSAFLPFESEPIDGIIVIYFQV